MHWVWRALIAVSFGSILDWALFVCFAFPAFAISRFPFIFVAMATIPVAIYALLPERQKTGTDLGISR